MAMASPGFLPSASFALATCGEEPAPLIIFLKNPRAAAPGLSELRLAQRLAAVIKRRLLFEHLVEQADGVIRVVPLRRLVALGEQQTGFA